MQSIILVIHVLVAIAIIALVLIQHGKGADAGAAFGSGASGTMFGSQGATPFLIKLTTALAALFFITSLTLSYYSAHQQSPEHELLKAISTTPQTQQANPAKAASSKPSKNKPEKQQSN